MTINVVRPDENTRKPGFYRFHVISDAAGGTQYLPLSGLFRPTTQAGIVMQGVGPGTISYSLTLADEDKAVDPSLEIQSLVPWSAPISLSCGPIIRDPNFLLATAIKLTIVGPAELYVAVL